MRRYSSSRIRIGLFCLMLGAIVLMVASRSNAQTAGGVPGASASTDDVHERTNPFALLMRKDTLTDFVFWTMLVCSILGVTLIVQGFIKVRESVMLPEESTNQIREMIQARQFKELIDFTGADPSFVSKSLNPALKRAPSFSAMKEAMETAVAEQTAEQFRKIEYLNIIGNLGPLLGLLGTVFGMIDSFQALKDAKGNASPAALSGGISLALTHTMLGLMLAIPCLAAFGVLRTMVDRMTTKGALISEELLLMIKPAEAKPALGAPARSAATPQPIRKAAASPAPVVPAQG